MLSAIGMAQFHNGIGSRKMVNISWSYSVKISLHIHICTDSQNVELLLHVTMHP